MYYIHNNLKNYRDETVISLYRHCLLANSPIEL